MVSLRRVSGRAENGLATPTDADLSHGSSSIRHHQSAQELRHMCSIQTLPSQSLPLCGCGSEPVCGCGSKPVCGCGSKPVCGCGNMPGSVGCLHCNSQPRVVACRQLSTPCCNHSAATIPVAGNRAYESGDVVTLGTNPAYTVKAQDQALPTPPFAAPPPPPYSEVNKVKSIHEYDYIKS